MRTGFFSFFKTVYAIIFSIIMAILLLSENISYFCKKEFILSNGVIFCIVLMLLLAGVVFCSGQDIISLHISNHNRIYFIYLCQLVCRSNIGFQTK